MKKSGLVFGLAIVVGACNGTEPEIDKPEEAPVTGAEATPATSEEGEGEVEPSPEPAINAEKEPEVKAAETQATQANTIPTRFHGTWDVEDSDCLNFSDGVTEVSAKQVGYYEGGIEVTSVTTVGEGIAIKGDYSEGGMDGTKDASLTLSLVPSAGGPKLKSSDREGFAPLKKCK